jgi:hypothetical protein
LALGPRQVLIIRHAEKPHAAGAGANTHLSMKGFVRASALPQLFTGRSPTCEAALEIDPNVYSAHYGPADDSAHPRFATPHFLIAAAASKHSNRSKETLTPVAAALGVGITAQYSDDEFGTVAEHVLTDERYLCKVVLIAWHHETLPAFAKALGVTDPAPNPWPDDVFDRIWQLEYEDGRIVAFRNLPQQLLYGDSRM